MEPQKCLSSYKTLKLDASFNPLAVISATEALVQSLLCKVIVLETYDKKIYSVSASFPLPAVIVLRKVVKKTRRSLPCCRKYLLVRDQFQCQYCNKLVTAKTATIDHVVPKSKGGKYEWENVVIACSPCNQKKGSSLLKNTNFRLKTQPKQLTYRRFFEKFEESILWIHYLK